MAVDRLGWDTPRWRAAAVSELVAMIVRKISICRSLSLGLSIRAIASIL
jgi:hypothetical protein